MRREKGGGMCEKRRVRLLVAVLAISLGFAPVFQAGITLADVTKKDVAQAKDKVSALEQEKKKVEQTIKNLESLKSDTAAYVKKLDASLQELEDELSNLEVQIAGKEDEIAATQEELLAARKKEQEQYEAMKLRIRYMYERGDVSYLEMLMQAQSMSDFLSRAEYISQISQYDRQQLDLYVQVKEDIAEHESALLAEREELLGFQEQTQAKQTSVETLMNQKTAEIKSYEGQITDAEREASEYQKDIAAQEQAIQEMEAEIKRQEEEARRKAEEEARRKAEEEARKKAEEEARKKAEEEAKKKAEQAKKAQETTQAQKTDTSKNTAQSSDSNKTTSAGNSKFIWPCPSSSRITSEFGSRESPTKGASSNHQGIDIGASTGSNIVAAAGGSVVISTYSYSAGNYVMINHGGGVYTVYMHCSKLLVSVGDTVKQGQVIAKVGSTGYSTGSHLHFGVRVNGSYVNPRKYVSP